MRRNNNNTNPKAVPPDLLPESDACRLAYRLQNKESDGEDRRRAKKNKPKTIIEGPVRRWTPKRMLCCAGWIFCCPIYTLCWALRESHVDEDDLRDDDCYPCFS